MTTSLLWGMSSFLEKLLLHGARRNINPLLSSTEMEYRVVTLTTSELMGTHNLLHKLGVSLSTPVIYYNNLSVTHLSANPIFHSKMKHLAIAFYFIREQVQLGFLHVTHVPTGDQLADFLTKPLSRPRLDVLLSKIGLVDPTCVRLAGAYILEIRLHNS